MKKYKINKSSARENNISTFLFDVPSRFCSVLESCGDIFSEPVTRRCSVKKVFLEISQNSQENTCARVSFFKKTLLKNSNFIKKETLAQVFSCEFCEISKNTFSYRTPPVAASVFLQI